MSGDWDLDEAEEAAAELHEAAFGEEAPPPVVTETSPELQATAPLDWPTPPRLSDFFDRTSGEIDWLWDKLLMRGSVNILGAYMKVGKSSLVMNIVRGLIEQKHLFGFSMNLPEDKRIFWFAPEDSERIIRYNLNHAGIEPYRYESQLVLVTKGEPYLERLRAQGSLKKKWAMLKEALVRDRAEVIILDTMNTFSHYLGLVEENDNQAVTRLMDMVAELKDLGITVIITQHTGKNQERGGTLQSIRGASAYAALADQIMLLTQPNPDQRSTQRLLTIIGRTSVDSPGFMKLDYDKSTATYHRLPDDAAFGGTAENAVELLERFLEKDGGSHAAATLRGKCGIGNARLSEIFADLKAGKELGRLRLRHGRVFIEEDPDLPFEK
jgi:hypothetical protein